MILENKVWCTHFVVNDVLKGLLRWSRSSSLLRTSPRRKFAWLILSVRLREFEQLRSSWRLRQMESGEENVNHAPGFWWGLLFFSQSDRGERGLPCVCALILAGLTFWAELLGNYGVLFFEFFFFVCSTSEKGYELKDIGLGVVSLLFVWCFSSFPLQLVSTTECSALLVSFWNRSCFFCLIVLFVCSGRGQAGICRVLEVDERRIWIRTRFWWFVLLC